ncbi:MAG TPA: tetratricopeptide repeat protein [Clostridia bacterium]|nr:tetratricopeptide repeat protein [Clostridia bacterium]
MEWIKYLSIIIVSIVLLIILLVYKKPLVKMLTSVASTKRFEKTKDGFKIEVGGSESDDTLLLPSSRKEIINKDIVENNCVNDECDHIGDGDKPFDWISHYMNKDYDIAIKVLERLIDKAEDSKEVADNEYIIGLCLLKKDFNSGYRKLNSFAEKYPSDSRPYLALSSEYLLCKLPNEAINILDLGISKIKDNCRILKRKVEVLTELERFPEALDIISMLAEHYPNDIECNTLKADIYIKKNDLDNAYASYNMALMKNPSDENLLKVYAAFLYNSNKKEEALSIYKRMIELYPKNENYIGLLGNTYLDLNFYNKALECYEKANELANNNQSWIIANIGNAYKNKGFYSKALECFTAALRIDPDSEYTHNRISTTYEAIREEEKRELDMINTVMKTRTNNTRVLNSEDTNIKA